MSDREDFEKIWPELDRKTRYAHSAAELAWEAFLAGRKPTEEWERLRVSAEYESDVVDDLLTAIENSALDVGHKHIPTILKELGPAFVALRDALRLLPPSGPPLIDQAAAPEREGK